MQHYQFELRRDIGTGGLQQLGLNIGVAPCGGTSGLNFARVEALAAGVLSKLNYAPIQERWKVLPTNRALSPPLIQHQGGANLIHQCRCFGVGTEDCGAFR